MPADMETIRLAARPPRAGDVAAMLAVYGDPSVAARLYPDARPRTEQEVGAMIDADLAHWAAHGFGRTCRSSGRRARRSRAAGRGSR